MTWPGVVPAGAVETKPVSALDLMPTVLAAAGGAGIKGDGVNLLPLGSIPAERDLF